MLKSNCLLQLVHLITLCHLVKKSHFNEVAKQPKQKP